MLQTPHSTCYSGYIEKKRRRGLPVAPFLLLEFIGEVIGAEQGTLERMKQRIGKYGNGKHKKLERWQQFKTAKERGEWVELLFMAAAALHGFHVLKPWGECLEYDVGIEHAGDLLRVQVKSSSARNGTGYLCQFRRNYLVEEPYSLDYVDLFATYVIPEQVWYLIPAAVLLMPTIKHAVTLCPVTAVHQDRYKYEHYREAWGLLAKHRRELAHPNRQYLDGVMTQSSRQAKIHGKSRRARLQSGLKAARPHRL